MRRWPLTPDSGRLLALGKTAVETWSSAVEAVLATRERAGALRRSAVAASAVTPLRISIWLGVFILLCFVYFAPRNDAGQDARIDVAVAIVDHGTFAIDQYAANTIDKDQVGQHFYSNKAPGSSFLAVPVYLLYKGYLASHGGLPADPANDPQLRYLESVCLVSIPATLFLLFFFWFLGFFARSLIHRAAVTLGLGLGTIVFPYAQNYYAHVTVGMLLFVAFALIYLATGNDTVRGRWTRCLADNADGAALLAGLVLGTAILLEYPPAVIALLITGYAWVRLPRQSFPYLIVGVLPPLAMIMAYNHAVYGNPLTLGYASGTSVNFSQQQGLGIGGFTWPPSGTALWGMSFSPFRGLFFLSPFLLLSLPGFALWRRRGGGEWRLFLAISAIFFLLISMYWAWYGGWSVGPRYLIPLLPFLAFPAIFTLDALAFGRIRRDVGGLLQALAYGLLFFSVVNVWGEAVSSAGYLWPDTTNQDPLISAFLPGVLQGGIMANQGTMRFGLDPGTSIYLLAALLALWSLIIFMPPAVQWANYRSGWLAPGTPPSWAAWWRRIALIPPVARQHTKLQRLQMYLRSVSVGTIPAPPPAREEARVPFRPEYAFLRRPDAGWQLALWLTLGMVAALELLGSWAVIAHGATTTGAWTTLIIQTDKSWSDVFSFWQRWDALWFQQIAEHGYHAGDGTFAFGPLYPLLTNIVSPVLGGAPVAAELIVSMVAFAVAMFVLYCLVRQIAGPLTAALTVLLLTLFPTGFLLLAPDSVGLLLALTLLALWWAHRDRPWLAGLAGLGAALADPMGVIVALALVVVYVQRRQAEGRPLGIQLCSTGLPLLGPIMFNAYLRIAVGEGHWYLPWSRLPQVPQTPVLSRGDPLVVTNLVCLVGFALLLMAASRRLPPAQVVYAATLIGFLGFSAIVAPLTDIAHYGLLLFPCFVILALGLVRRPAVAAGWLLLSLVLQGTLLMYWVQFAYLG